MGSLGVIGEDSNKLLSYLVMTSRKLPEPLALLILSGSGAGKSYLQDTVLALCPEEDLVKLTSLTDQALFYRGEDSLRHKVLALEEQAGAKGADYPDAQLDFRPQAGDRNHREEPADGPTGNPGQHGVWADGRLPNHHQPAHRRGDPQPVHPDECR